MDKTGKSTHEIALELARAIASTEHFQGEPDMATLKKEDARAYWLTLFKQCHDTVVTPRNASIDNVLKAAKTSYQPE